MSNKRHQNNDYVNPLSRDNVIKLKHAFKESLENQIRQISTDNMSESHIHALRKYITVQMMNREKLSTKQIQKTAQLSEDMIRGLTKTNISPLFDTAQRKEIRKSVIKRYKKHGHGLLKTSQRRLYFPLISSGDKSETEIKVENHLNKNGYFIRCYKQGYATDIKGKQEYKIGKLIKENENLSKSFMADDTRVSSDQYLVLSDYANDIAYMSTRRGWQSCMSHDGINKEMVPADVELGTIIGYLVNKNDPNIYDPLARVLFKPLYNDQGDVRYHVNKCYGLHHDAFKQTAENVAEQLSSNANGVFKLPEMIYDDGAVFETIHISEDIEAEEFFNILKIDYIKSNSGQIIIKGNLDLSYLGLQSLPDLTRVKVKGHFYCKYNELTSLIGSPSDIEGNFNCNANYLISLKGAPKEVKGGFYCAGNELVSLEYAPQKVGGDFSCGANSLTSLRYAPQKIEGYFSCELNRLTSLEGAPKSLINGRFDCRDNSLGSLNGLPRDFTALWSDWGEFSEYNNIPKRYFKNSKSRQVIIKIKRTLCL